MRLSLLSALLAALSLLFMPLAMAGAATPAPAPQTSGMDGHCHGEEPGSEDKNGAGERMACASACSALHVTAPAPPERSAVVQLAPAPAIRSLSGVPPEAATPPPRTPAI